MKNNFAALAGCKNDQVKLRILSARDSEVLAGYRRAWPEYFMDDDQPSYPVSYPMSARLIKHKQANWLKNTLGLSAADAEAMCDRSDWRQGCARWNIPTIEVLWPTHRSYGHVGIKATRGLLFQLGDFSEAKPGTVVRLYHTKWVIVYVDRKDMISVTLAPLECIDLEH